MKPYDDLDRLLAQLPLAEPPASLCSRILTATVGAPAADTAVPWWEQAVYGVLFALVVWVAMVVATSPAASGIASAILAWTSTAIQLPTLLWTAIGGVFALWFLLLTGRDGGLRLRA